MLPKKRTLSAVACMVMLAIATTARPQTTDSCYPRTPKVLSDEVDKTVDFILQNNAQALGLTLPALVAFTIADVVASKEMGEESYQYYGEVRRTDQQVGASSTSSGSTSAVEKPGLIDLIGFAIERGAIQQSVNDSTVTLSTSPYAFVVAAKGKDSPTTYQDNELLTRLGVSATFILNDPNNTLGSVSRKQLTEWSAKVRLTGDRSTRSSGFRKFWDQKLGNLEQTRLNIISAMETQIFRIPAFVDRFKTGGDHDAVTPLVNKITAYLTSKGITPTPNPAPLVEAHNAIKEMILCTLFTEVHEPVRNGTIKVDEVVLKSALSQLAEVQRLITVARTKFRADVKEWVEKGNLSTFVYTNHRVANGSDYSEFKLLFERHVNPLELVLNANFSIYNKPDPAKNQEKLRDFSFAGSLEWGSKRNPLFRGDEEMATPITVSANGRYERLMENENMSMRAPDIGSFQARLEIPIAPGFSIPIAYTYSTATEMMPKPENRFNVGLHIDVNKILNFKKATKDQ